MTKLAKETPIMVQDWVKKYKLKNTLIAMLFVPEWALGLKYSYDAWVENSIDKYFTTLATIVFIYLTIHFLSKAFQCKITAIQPTVILDKKIDFAPTNSYYYMSFYSVNAEGEGGPTWVYVNKKDYLASKPGDKMYIFFVEPACQAWGVLNLEK